MRGASPGTRAPPPGDVGSILNMLRDREIERDVELRQYPQTSPHDDDDNGSTSPHFDRYLTEGERLNTDSIQQMTNFSVAQFNALWLSIRPHVIQRYTGGRGRRSQIRPKDAFFMTATTLKHAGTWEMLANMFQLHTSTFSEVVTKFIRLISTEVYDREVVQREQDVRMPALRTSGHVFPNFESALYAVDVTFQQTYRPGGSIQDNKSYFSENHHLYGFKVEVSVSPRGFAVNCTDHARGSTAHITMFKNNIAFHQRMMKKLDSDKDFSDGGLLLDEYPDQWAILADKEYQGLSRQLRCIHPKKGANLTPFDKANNNRISNDRVIVDNFFGRVSMLWRVCSEKYTWGEELYDDIFRLCVGLTNHHISYQPLCEETDAKYYRQVQHRLLSIGEEIKRKRRIAQEKYRMKKKRRTNTSLNDMGGESDDN